MLGTVLRPFCLGHHILLKRLGLPFAGNALADAGWEDILAGIAVCAMKHDRALETFLGGSWSDIFRRWLKDVRGPWWHRRNFDAAMEESLFRAYLAKGYELPPVMRYPGGTIEATAPWEELLKCRLVAHGFSESEVMGKYLPAAWYDYHTLAELHQEELAERIPKFKWRKIFYSQADAIRDENG